MTKPTLENRLRRYEVRRREEVTNYNRERYLMNRVWLELGRGTSCRGYGEGLMLPSRR